MTIGVNVVIVAFGTIVAIIGVVVAIARHYFLIQIAIVFNDAIGSIGAIGSPNDPLTLNGDCERN